MAPLGPVRPCPGSLPPSSGGHPLFVFPQPWPLKLGFSSPYDGNKTSKSRTDGASPEELGALLEEEEEAGGDEDQEKEILIEQLQSIKEEKEDITYRLPELDPRGSDEENVDSETSASTESLLDERGGRGVGSSSGPAEE